MQPALKEIEETGLSLSYSPKTLKSVPVYDETSNSVLDDAVRHVIVEDGVHEISAICERVKDMGLPCSIFVVLRHIQKNISNEFVEIQSGMWEHRRTLVDEIHEFILSGVGDYEIKRTGAMPELKDVVRPQEIVSLVPRYMHLGLDPEAFARASLESVRSTPEGNLVAVNHVVCNFRDALVKDIYNVLLRERAPLGALDIALRLFDSKVGVYKKTLKAMVEGKRTKGKLKPVHLPLHPHEIYKLSKVVESIIEQVMKCGVPTPGGRRTDVFVRLPDGRVNAYRNHIGVISINLNEKNRVIINMQNEFDVQTKVGQIIDDNRPFLSKLTKQFRANIDEDEIQSRFFEKLWQAIIQYDEIWGYKFHTFLHKTLKNILLDERVKSKKRLQTVSLQTPINDKNQEELGNVYRDKIMEKKLDPGENVKDIRFIEMVEREYDEDTTNVIFSIMNGMKGDREIATHLNKIPSEIASIKRRLRNSQHLIRWLYQ